MFQQYHVQKVNTRHRKKGVFSKILDMVFRLDICGTNRSCGACQGQYASPSYRRRYTCNQSGCIQHSGVFPVGMVCMLCYSPCNLAGNTPARNGLRYSTSHNKYALALSKLHLLRTPFYTSSFECFQTSNTLEIQNYRYKIIWDF